jgi:hypothetical protein
MTESRATAVLDAQQVVDRQFLQMRWRCLSLAADLDRIQRAPGGPELLRQDPRLQTLFRALAVLLDPTDSATRAQRVQMLFSDTTPPPARGD